MPIDINNLSARELESLISQAKKRKTTLNKRKPITAVRKKIALQAKNEGYTIDELFGNGSGPAREPRASSKGAARKTRRSLGKVAPKYRNPENESETWSGRGKQPRWLAAYTDAGRNRDEFLIK
ncbi:MAG: H-NS histone family protein [Pseudomonadota bacterium]|nr:H-NS histone family protein [Pseudomonadota bacterium]